jgi:transposase InsO family protein
MMCDCLGVTRSCYYAWCNLQPSARAKEDGLLCEGIRVIFEISRQTYGTRRIRRELFKEGKTVSRRRIGKLMRLMGLSCKTKRKFRLTTDSKHKLPIADNLLQRQFDVDAPDRFYVGDITYIHTQSGWLYLAVVIDLFSRKVVGWAMDKNMRAELVNDALLMAIWKRKPAAGLVSHTDRGSQYASDSHRQILKDHAIQQSMSRKGNCWDNAVAESFFHTLKTELVHHTKFKTQEEARLAIFEYLEVFYNRIRTHSANDYLSPEEFESAFNF